ncbi:hypothetical protein P4H39_32140 [Paenibacillus lautus]|uniref:hypothetical protein n=1 Tax=Paenibacillus lautus TaxID=1401 RepID=UPI002DC01866|nr:hypothetical protein [Paenibacillus lautus]MEC0207263.1 hypothetical protein [Paenibacillus lautus]
MPIVNKAMVEDVYTAMLEITTSGQNVYTQIEKYVEFLQNTHKNVELMELKNNIFKTLLQILLPYLKKVAIKLYFYDPLIDKTAPKKRGSLFSDNPLLPEHLVAVSGILWEIILSYDPSRGVYFTHYMQLQFDWHYKKLIRARMRKKKYIARPDDDYKIVSYEELTEKKDHDTENYTYGSAKIGDMSYDDNFDVITFEWSLKEPQEFVDDITLYEIVSDFTPKQMEVFSMELEGFYQEQIARELKEKGNQISQQAVSERLLGVRKKIEKIQSKRGVLCEPRESSNHSA